MSENTPHDDPEFEAMLAAALGSTPHDAIDRAIEEAVPDPADLPDGHRSGFVAVVGRPNVGKSTLINQILGEKIAIVSAKPQTTRIRQLGIYNREDMQIIFVDTPGIHRPNDRLGTFMVEVAKAALEDADVILFLVDISTAPSNEDKQIIDYLKNVREQSKIIHVMNKVDQAKAPDKFAAAYETYRELLPTSDFIAISAIDGFRVGELLQKIIARLPEGPRYYPPDQVSDIPIKDIAAEMIREQVLRRAQQEVPHSIAVEVDEFKRRHGGLIYIHAVIYVERDGQKGIIIGKGGAMLKQISSHARQEIETFLGSKVFLEIMVKVLPNWRRDDDALKRFGYRL